MIILLLKRSLHENNIFIKNTVIKALWVHSMHINFSLYGVHF